MTYHATVTSPASLGLALQQARLAQGLTQRELASRLGTTQRYIWELESGKDSVFLGRLLSILRETGTVMTLDIPEGQDG